MHLFFLNTTLANCMVNVKMLTIVKGNIRRTQSTKYVNISQHNWPQIRARRHQESATLTCVEFSGKTITSLVSTTGNDDDGVLAACRQPGELV